MIGFFIESVQNAIVTFFSAYNGRINPGTASFLSSRSKGQPWNLCVPIDHQCSGLLRVPMIVARYAGEDARSLLSSAVGMVNSIQRSGLADASAHVLCVLLVCTLFSSFSASESMVFVKDIVLSSKFDEAKQSSQCDNNSSIRSRFHDRCVPSMYGSIEQANHALDYILSVVEILPTPSRDMLSFVLDDCAVFTWMRFIQLNALLSSSDSCNDIHSDDPSYVFRLLAAVMDGSANRVAAYSSDCNQIHHSANIDKNALLRQSDVLHLAISATPSSEIIKSKANKILTELTAEFNTGAHVDLLSSLWCTGDRLETDVCAVTQSFGLSGLLPGTCHAPSLYFVDRV